MTEKKLPELTAFFPFWNEEQNIEKVVTDAVRVLKQVADKWEVLMIDDGSTDRTVETAKQLEKKIPNVHLLSHNINRGYGAALKTGFEHAKYEYIVFTDGDRQFDFGEVTKFIEKVSNADIVIGFRKKREDAFFRHLLMLLHRLWGMLFFGIFVRDIDCGFKLFRREAVKAISPLRSEGAMITTEILAKAKNKKLRIAQVGVTHYPRKFGESSGGNVAVIIRAMLETFILFWDIRNKRF
jgi:glycosyltransferase involved in cell wall biosynthesis